MNVVCPRCKGRLWTRDAAYGCDACRLEFPVVCGIPDFRLAPDPYIGIDDDRRKAERLTEAGADRTFEELLRYYYAVTPEDPSDLAKRWIAHALAEPRIAASLLFEHGIHTSRAVPGDALLDVGCSTGGLLIAAHQSFAACVGVDVALRWLAVGQIRMREAGIDVTLICANAEHLPFPDGSFAAITCTDTLEHVRDADAAVAEAHRVSVAGARLLCTANNRFAPLPEPNIGIWGVGFLPRRWQAPFVRRRRGDLHPYRIQLRSTRELRRIAVAAGYANARVTPAPLIAPHAMRSIARRALWIYNRARTLPVMGRLLSEVGPRVVLTADATASSRQSPSAAARDGT